MSSASVLRGEMLTRRHCHPDRVGQRHLHDDLRQERPFPDAPGWRWALAVSGIVAAAALVGPQCTVHTAVAVCVPAGVPTGGPQPRGVDAMGRRLIMMAGVVLSLLLFALPGGLAGGVVWLALHRLLGTAALVPAAAVFTLAVMGEVLMAVELLAPAYERLDLTSVERPE